MAEQIITLGIGATPATLTPFITSGLEIGEGIVVVGVEGNMTITFPTFTIRPVTQVVPFLLDEGGNILTDESGAPLLAESSAGRLKITPPTLRARRVS